VSKSVLVFGEEGDFTTEFTESTEEENRERGLPQKGTEITKRVNLYRVAAVPQGRLMRFEFTMEGTEREDSVF